MLKAGLAACEFPSEGGVKGKPGASLVGVVGAAGVVATIGDDRCARRVIGFWSKAEYAFRPAVGLVWRTWVRFETLNVALGPP